jgi:hypothetical protein
MAFLEVCKGWLNFESETEKVKWRLGLTPFPLHAHENTERRGVSHCMALPFTLKSILRQKKNYGNSNTSPCQNITFK